jgi:hypothetical protein
MKCPEFTLSAGTAVRTHRRLDPAHAHLSAGRRPNAPGAIAWLTHGGDVYVVDHQDGTQASYCFTELELGHEEEASSPLDRFSLPVFTVRGAAVAPANQAADEILAEVAAKGEEVLFFAANPKPRSAYEGPEPALGGSSELDGDMLFGAALIGFETFLADLRRRMAERKAVPMGTDTGAGCDAFRAEGT